MNEWSDIIHLPLYYHYNFNSLKAQATPDWRQVFPLFEEIEIDLIQSLLKMNPDHRLSAQEALMHPFLKLKRNNEQEKEKIQANANAMANRKEEEKTNLTRIGIDGQKRQANER